MACGWPGSGRVWAPGWSLVTGNTHLGELWETAEGMTVSVPHIPPYHHHPGVHGARLPPPSLGTEGDPQHSSYSLLTPRVLSRASVEGGSWFPSVCLCDLGIISDRPWMPEAKEVF